MKRFLYIIYIFGLHSACWPRNSGQSLSEFSLPALPGTERQLRGSEFTERIELLTSEGRELEIEKEITGGNFPSYLRQFVPVFIDGTELGENSHRLLIFVMPDYLSIGIDSDFIRMPMSPVTGQRIADALGMMLPTPKMVDEIYRNSQFLVKPTSLPAGSRMSETKYYVMHNLIIERQSSQIRRGLLMSGQKKDVVITPKLIDLPDRVAIYGWHKNNGQPVQRLNLDHGRNYADYSHGVRLISRHAILDGVEVDLADILKDKRLNFLLSYEGIVRSDIYDRKPSRIGLAH